MSNKTKKIIAISVLIIIFIAIIIVVATLKINNSNDNSETFEVWNELPNKYLDNNQESESSIEKVDDFQTEISNKLLEVFNYIKHDNGEINLTSMYFTSVKDPTLIISYASGNKNSYYVFKYINNKVFSLEIEGSFKDSSIEEDIQINANNNILVYREGMNSSLGKQTIYDFKNGDYSAVKYNEYELSTTENMNQTLIEYNETDNTYLSYKECSIKENIITNINNELLSIRTKMYVSGRGRNSPAVLPVDQAGFLRTSLRKASSSSAVGTLTMPT